MWLFPTTEVVYISDEDENALVNKLNDLIDNKATINNREGFIYKGWVDSNSFVISRKGMPVLSYKPELIGSIKNRAGKTEIIITARMSAGAQTNILLQLLLLGGGVLLMNWAAFYIQNDWSIYTLVFPIVFISIVYLLQIGFFLAEAKRDFVALKRKLSGVRLS